MSLRAFLGIMLLLVGGQAPADITDWYLGGSIGRSAIDASSSEIERAFLEDDGFVASDTSLDDTDSGWKLYAGYRLLPILALEAGWVDLGEATFRTTIVDAPPPFDAAAPFDIRGTADADGPTLSALVHLPVTSRVDVLGRVGVFRWKANFTERLPDTGTVRVDRSEDDIDLQYGVGIQFALTDTVGARAEWERFESVGRGIGGRSGSDVDFFSLGLTVGF